MKIIINLGGVCLHSTSHDYLVVMNQHDFSWRMHDQCMSHRQSYCVLKFCVQIYRCEMQILERCRIFFEVTHDSYACNDNWLLGEFGVIHEFWKKWNCICALLLADPTIEMITTKPRCELHLLS